MVTKTVNRTIHPSTHKSEHSYRVKIGKRNYYDQLIVHINHENKNFNETYVFDGEAIAAFESIHFKAEEINGNILIQWVQNIKYSKL